jgi:hypothetical protein
VAVRERASERRASRRGSGERASERKAASERAETDKQRRTAAEQHHTHTVVPFYGDTCDTQEEFAPGDFVTSGALSPPFTMLDSHERC